MKAIVARVAVGALATLLFIACHPVKKIQKQDAAIDELKAKWIGDYILSHPCPSIPEINLDSLCALYHPVDTSDVIPWIGLGDSATTMTSGAAPTQGSRSFPWDHPPQRILVPWEDTRQLNLLKDSLRIIQQRMAALQGNQSAKAQDCSAAVSDANKRTTKWEWFFVAACVVIAAGGAIKIYSLIKNPLKIL